ncbi:MAG: ribosome biogenesis GTPase Der [Rhodospirillales bacterium]|nr:MAG: ribosome biogenesis GTPase Der [Rhodospirillales bacterium]
MDRSGTGVRPPGAGRLPWPGDHRVAVHRRVAGTHRHARSGDRAAGGGGRHPVLPGAQRSARRLPLGSGAAPVSRIPPLPCTVVIVGRPNVGKSTLFNRLVGRKLALVDDTPGVTRDRREGAARLSDLKFMVVDTAGLEEAGGDDLTARMQRQTERAIAAADVVLLLIDARAGLTPLDAVFADAVRRTAKPVILVANKCEGKASSAGLLESYALGLGEPVPVSAEHGEGMADLYQALRPLVDAAAVNLASAESQPDEGPLQLAVVGRPNVGKSTLINRLVGEDRLLTGPEAGITRDAIQVAWTWRGRAFRLVDTAGLRRKARVEGKLERLAAGDTLRAIRFAHVAVIVIDATVGLDRQDLNIAALVADEGRAPVIALNKWDLVSDPQLVRNAVAERLDASLPQCRGVTTVPISALTGRGLDRLLAAVVATYEVWETRLTTAELNRWLATAVEHHPPPQVQGRRIRLRYMTQVKARPPTFVLFASRAAELPESYVRYLVGGLRDSFGLAGVPIRLHLRQGRNPYAPDRK